MVVDVGLTVATKTGSVVVVVVVGAVVVVVLVGSVVVVGEIVVVVVGEVLVVVVVVVVAVLIGFFEKSKTVTLFPPAKKDVFLFVFEPKIFEVLVLFVELVLINLAEPPLVLNRLTLVVGAVLVVLDLKNLEKNAPTF